MSILCGSNAYAVSRCSNPVSAPHAPVPPIAHTAGDAQVVGNDGFGIHGVSGSGSADAGRPNTLSNAQLKTKV